MSRQHVLAAAHVPRLVTTLLEAGFRVYGPILAQSRAAGLAGHPAGRATEYRRIGKAEDLALSAPMPALPLKALFLPPTETLFGWRRQHNDVTLLPVQAPATPAVVLGARPCDAAAVQVLDKVMGWDYRDELWFARREATTIVTLACDAPGRDCFCQDVGLAPDTRKGADVMLTRRGEDFEAEAVTEKGAALLERCAGCFATEAREAAISDGPEAVASDRRDASDIDVAAMQQWLASHFDHPLWAEIGLRCHGCGACASVCPTCHCFDIVDEPDGLLAGTRRRNWDTCQASKFTLHASGHNPRADQNARFRQRVLHKFSIYPQRFGEVLCTGCGRCVEACPAGQNLPEILQRIMNEAMR